MDTICANFGWPNADVFGAQRRPGATTVSDHGGSRTVLPEGVLPQWLHQEPEATRALLQHARRFRISVQRHFRALPDRNNGKGRLLAYSRSSCRAVPGSDVELKCENVARVVEVHELLQALDVAIVEELLLE